MNRFRKVFSTRLPAIIGMIHVQPLPGTPCYTSGSYLKILEQAKIEAETYIKAGVDAIMIENMHDIPYNNRRVGPEITASMAVVAHDVKKVIGNSIPCGIQILAGCNMDALAVAKATGLDFMRAEGFIFSHIADEGLMNADAGELLRYRKMIDADDVLILTDIKKKHSSHVITNDLPIEEVCQAAEFFLTDGVILTGSSTGKSASANELKNVISSCNLPVLIGSGVTTENFENFSKAHGIIVGSYFKDEGYWKNRLSKERVCNFMEVVKKYRENHK